jgi:hypothetical protein
MGPFELVVQDHQNRHGGGDHGEIPNQPLQIVSRGCGDASSFGVRGLQAPPAGNRQSQSPHRGRNGLTGASVGPPAISDRACDPLNRTMLADATNSMSHAVCAATKQNRMVSRGPREAITHARFGFRFAAALGFGLQWRAKCRGVFNFWRRMYDAWFHDFRSGKRLRESVDEGQYSLIIGVPVSIGGSQMGSGAYQNSASVGRRPLGRRREGVRDRSRP